jgi:predicted nucleotidyltransferase
VLIIRGAEVDEARLAAICNRYGIAELKIFGSQARGTAQPGSDIDILYTLRPGHRLGWEIEQLADELAEPFRRPRRSGVRTGTAPAAAALGPG